MAGLGWKRWTRERLTAAEVQGYLQDQVIMHFDSASQRDAVLPESGLSDGMVCYLEDVDDFFYREVGGSIWRPLSARWPVHTGGPLPSYAAGIRDGELFYSTVYQCALIVGNGGYQQASAVTGTSLNTYVASLQAAGIGSLHNGFLYFDTQANRMYACIGNLDFVLVGGYPAPRVITGFPSAKAGWSYVAGGTTWVRSNGNGTASLYLQMTKVDAAITVPVSGDIGNVDIGQVPAAYNPYDSSVLVSGAGGRAAHGYIGTDGVIALVSTTPGSSIAIGETISLSGSYRLADQTF